MKSTFKMLALAGAMSSLLAGEVQASTLIYTLNQSNVDSVLSDGVNYLTVKIEDGLAFGTDTNAVKFTVNILDGVFNFGTHTSYGIQAFGFNQAVGAPTLLDANIVGPSGWSGNVPNPPNQFDGFGKFFGATAGSGVTRFNPLEFWITGVAGDTASSYAAASSGNAGQGNAWFAAHVAGFIIDGSAITSGYFGGGNGITPPPVINVSEVPLPAAAWMLGIGLMAVSSLNRRKSLAT
ncbi:VPLPA-CTERM sorting domain-containing protein [Methylobacter sp.]|uniref:VPLPA-CTERM sorting domain-containing protein n=1 Tax=Methylobacter sp. TaxID=2051955 RepID=UPI00120BC279|nr:VPLPA-CTERM sorting domain-containing protein [Methylobacter sp.]TAK64810.1 MAG: hypothetical protein EPO18_02100 [Methylobacter sp.]